MSKAIFNSSLEAIEYFKARVEAEPDFKDLLLVSLKKAKTRGKQHLNPLLFNALVWPESIEDYVDYLIRFSKWMPQQTNHPAWIEERTGNAQEIYDRVCHFYWLVDQPVGKNESTIIQNIEYFNHWLAEYARLWGSFLDTPESFNDEILNSFIKNARNYRVEDSMIDGRPNNPSGWHTFNQFFARQLNPGLRPIESPFDNKVICSPADCTYVEQYPIEEDSTIKQIVLKKTHHFASIPKLLKGSEYGEAFAGGTFVHYFLGPYSYHHFHMPVAGKVKECYAIQGLTYLEVGLANGRFDVPDNSETGYEFSQARGVIIIDTKNSPYGDVGLIAVVPVGMAQVSSVNMIAMPNSHLLKGDEFGYFMFGGSDIILLYQKGRAPQINTSKHYRLYGSDLSKGAE